MKKLFYKNCYYREVLSSFEYINNFFYDDNYKVVYNMIGYDSIDLFLFSFHIELHESIQQKNRYNFIDSRIYSNFNLISSDSDKDHCINIRGSWINCIINYISHTDGKPKAIIPKTLKIKYCMSINNTSLIRCKMYNQNHNNYKKLKNTIIHNYRHVQNITKMKYNVFTKYYYTMELIDNTP